MATPNVRPSAGESSHLALFIPGAPDACPVAPPTALPGAQREFEIGHVVFIDIVGYSKLLIDEQSKQLGQLNDLVRATPQFRRGEAQGQLMRLPTGDGMALIFRNSPEAPAQCALEIADALKMHPQIKLRMGIHSGPVNQIPDVNERANAAGAGINIAQRVMDCGDAGHILLSRHVAEDLEHSARWQPYLHDLGDYEVKHGLVVSIVNLFTPELGNTALPTKLAHVHGARGMTTRNPSAGKRSRQILMFSALVALALIAAFWFIANNYDGRSTSTPPVTPTQPSRASTKIPEKSIAVLPFENLSANPETAFFTEGVQDEILTGLARVADLKVISRTSVMQYKVRSRRNLPEIAQQLGVAHVLEGSVQRVADRIRVNAQLIDARTDAHLWAQTYDRELADVFAIQSEIARAIADQLQAKLSANEEAAIHERPTGDLAAYDLYLQATQIDRNRASTSGSGGAEEARREAALLTEAVKHDSGFVPAFCLLAQTHLYLYWLNADQPAAHLEQAKQALAAAERLQPQGGEVHLTRAIAAYWGSRDYASALAELALARRSLPNNISVLFFTAMIERRQDNWADSTRHLEQALALDPCNLTVVAELSGTNYFALRRYDDAVKTLESALAWKPLDFGLAFLRAYIEMAWKADLTRWKTVMNGEFTKTADANDLVTARIDLALKERDYRGAEQLLSGNGGTESDSDGFFTPREWKQGLVARALGQPAKANAALLIARRRADAAAQAHPKDAKALIVLAQIDAALGRKEDALHEGEHATALLPIAKDALNGYQLRARLTSIYAQAGEADRAFASLQQGIDQPYGPTYGSLKLDEGWDALRSDQRFAKLVAAVAPKD